MLAGHGARYRTCRSVVGGSWGTVSNQSLTFSQLVNVEFEMLLLVRRNSRWVMRNSAAATDMGDRPLNDSFHFLVRRIAHIITALQQLLQVKQQVKTTYSIDLWTANFQKKLKRYVTAAICGGTRESSVLQLPKSLLYTTLKASDMRCVVPSLKTRSGLYYYRRKLRCKGLCSCMSFISSGI